MAEDRRRMSGGGCGEGYDDPEKMHFERGSWV